MNGVPQSGWLTFGWRDREKISFLLPGFIALSAFGHLVMFYLVQVIYPPAVAITPLPVQVSLLTRDTSKDPTLFHWLEAEDPARGTASAEVSPPGLFEVPYQPSYANAQTQPIAPPVPVVRTDFPPPKSALEIVQRALSPATQPFPEIKGSRTLVKFSGTLAGRKARIESVEFPTKAVTDLQPTKYLVAVGERGEVLYTFLQSGSGDSAIDRQAERHLSAIEFEPAADAPLTWGFATYFWGVEAYAPAAGRPPENGKAP